MHAFTPILTQISIIWFFSRWPAIGQNSPKILNVILLCNDLFFSRKYAVIFTKRPFISPTNNVWGVFGFGFWVSSLNYQKLSIIKKVENMVTKKGWGWHFFHVYVNPTQIVFHLIVALLLYLYPWNWIL